MQRLLRRSRSLEVTDFGTYQKLIYDFLLVINSLAYLVSCTISKLWLIIGQISLARGECLTLTLSLG